MLGQRFQLAGEASVRHAIHLDHVGTQGAQQPRHRHPTHAGTPIDRDREAASADRLQVQVLEAEHASDVPFVGPALVALGSQRLEPDPQLVPGFVALAHSLAAHGIQEFPPCREKLEGVPFRGVVAGGQDHAPRGTQLLDRHLGRRRGGQPQIDHVATGGQKPRRHGAVHHRPRAARVATHHDCARSQRTAERRGEGGEHRWRQRFTDDATDAGDADHEGSRHRRGTIREAALEGKGLEWTEIYLRCGRPERYTAICAVGAVSAAASASPYHPPPPGSTMPSVSAGCIYRQKGTGNDTGDSAARACGTQAHAATRLTAAPSSPAGGYASCR